MALPLRSRQKTARRRPRVTWALALLGAWGCATTTGGEELESDDDSPVDDASGGSAATGAGGAKVVTGSGGVMSASGGTSAGGGLVGSGGAATGGNESTGGNPSGGAGTGGMGTGGMAMGGAGSCSSPDVTQQKDATCGDTIVNDGRLYRCISYYNASAGQYDCGGGGIYCNNIGWSHPSVPQAWELVQTCP